MKKRMVISLQGPQAIGKTTVTKRLQQRLPKANFSFENPYPIVAQRNKQKLDLSTLHGFSQNQKLFIEAECKRYENLPDGLTIMDRGPEDTECYTLNYPKTIGADWDMETILADDLKKLRKCKVDHILYLAADDHTLIKRKQMDSSRRKSTFQLDHFIIYEKWYRKHPRAEFLEVEGMSLDQVEEKIYSWIIERTID